MQPSLVFYGLRGQSVCLGASPPADSPVAVSVAVAAAALWRGGRPLSGRVVDDLALGLARDKTGEQRAGCRSKLRRYASLGSSEASQALAQVYMQ